MSISGHVNRKMVEHYSQPRLEAKRQAILTLNIPLRGDGSASGVLGEVTSQSTAQNLLTAASSAGK